MENLDVKQLEKRLKHLKTKKRMYEKDIDMMKYICEVDKAKLVREGVSASEYLVLKENISSLANSIVNKQEDLVAIKDEIFKIELQLASLGIVPAKAKKISEIGLEK